MLDECNIPIFIASGFISLQVKIICFSISFELIETIDLTNPYIAFSSMKTSEGLLELKCKMLVRYWELRKQHMSHVMNCRFLCNDTHLISVGGNDAAVFQWRHVNPDGSTVRTALKQASNRIISNNNVDDSNNMENSRISGSGRLRGHGRF